MGDNILGNAGDAWKLHRRIVAPVFNQDMYQHVWSTTVDLYKEIVEKEKWADSDLVSIQDASELTHKASIEQHWLKNQAGLICHMLGCR